MNTLVIDGKSLSVESCLETKMLRDVKLLYDVMADTIRHTSIGAVSLQLTTMRARSTHCVHASRPTRL